MFTKCFFVTHVVHILSIIIEMSLVECEYGASLLSGGDLLGITSSGDSGELMVSRRNGQIQVYNVCHHIVCVCTYQWDVQYINMTLFKLCMY